MKRRCKASVAEIKGAARADNGGPSTGVIKTLKQVLLIPAVSGLLLRSLRHKTYYTRSNVPSEDILPDGTGIACKLVVGSRSQLLNAFNPFVCVLTRRTCCNFHLDALKLQRIYWYFFVRLQEKLDYADLWSSSEKIIFPPETWSRPIQRTGQWIIQVSEPRSPNRILFYGGIMDTGIPGLIRSETDDSTHSGERIRQKSATHNDQSGEEE